MMIVQRFLHWLETAPKSSRADAAAALARAAISAEMSEQERDAAEVALTLLLDDPCRNVRLAMADALANSAETPRHLIMTLAGDETEISMQVLCRSPIFLDSELIAIANNGNRVSLIAIACRQPLSNKVASIIIDEQKLEASLALLQNPGIELSGQNLHKIASSLGNHGEIREHLLQQPKLPADIRQTLIAGVSSALQQLVTDRNWLGKSRAERVVRDARDRATEQLALDVAEDEIPQLVEHLRKSGQLSTAFLLRTVCGGNIPLFVAAIANLSATPEKRIRAVLQQRRTAAFRAIYDRSGLPGSVIPAITAAVDTWREEADNDAAKTDVHIRRRVIARIIKLYQATMKKPDEGLLALLQHIAAETNREAALMRAREIRTAA